MTTGAKPYRNERGVALLIVLLVTTLLIALIFEFAYGTRVSLRAAANFRDSQRAYFLAWSGINVGGKLLIYNLQNGKARENLEQQEWQIVPIISAGDVVLRVRWEDEDGKINIANVATGQQSLIRLERLFGIKQIDLDTVQKIHELGKIRLVDELHGVMNDADFEKIRDSVTVYGSDNVNVNTASSSVLQSLGLSEAAASMIIDLHKQDPINDKTILSGSYGLDPATLGMMVLDSNTFLVQSYATVGGYTKQAEAVISRSTNPPTVLYWKIL
jgi:type II secretory pathway component PulK